MSCPWAKIVQPEPVSFLDIVSEQVASDMQQKEEQKYLDEVAGPVEVQEIEDDIAIALEHSCDSDAEIARRLQMTFDREYDRILKQNEQKLNGSSKVSVSFDNYLRAPHNSDFESESEEEEVPDIRYRKNWDRFDALKKEYDSIPPCGYKVVNGGIITKHDGILCGRKNACKMLSFPPGFQTGDGEDFDMKLSNKVYNSLKLYTQGNKQGKNKIKDKKEDQATHARGLDESTALILYKLVNNQQWLKSIGGAICTGKEAVIIHALSNPDFDEFALPVECAVKVFMTTLAEFKQRDPYIKDDPRYKDRIGKQSANKTVPIWAEKEMHNLKRMKNAGIPCPDVVGLNKHVLVMEFIGKNGIAAPQLKQATLDDTDCSVAYEQVVASMKTMYNDAKLIHADLSEYNILWFKDQCYFIDVGQSVMPEHTGAYSYLKRDCENIVKYFSKRLPNVMSSDELFKAITGFKYEEKMEMVKVRQGLKMKPHLVDKPDAESCYNFDDAWNKSVNEDEN